MKSATNHKPAAINETIKITIFHTNDMHGRMEAIARLSSYARQCRRKAEAEGGLVFFWDAGDAADRRVRFCSIKKGAAYSHILNAMGYNLQTMGNAISLPYGPQAMKAVANSADFPILAANCRNKKGPLTEGLEEYVIIPVSEEVKMGVLGLTAPWGGMYELFGLQFPDFRELADEMINELKREGVALIVVLSHLGLEHDRRLAETVPGIDLIVGGHSHDRLPSGEEHHGVLIVQAGEFACSLGRVDLLIDSETGQLLDRMAHLLDVPEEQEPDTVVLAAIATAEEEVAELLSQPIGTLADELELDQFNECGIGNLTADILRERLGADAAMVASGQLHRGFPAGTLTFGQLDETYFSSANPGLTMVKGQQIKDALERGLEIAKNKDEHAGFRGTPVGIPQISGMQVWYDDRAEFGQRIQRVHINGEPITAERLYRLAHTDAETIAEIGYLILDEGQNTEYEVPTILREAIEDYIRNHSPIPRPEEGRWNHSGFKKR